MSQKYEKLNIDERFNQFHYYYYYLDIMGQLNNFQWFFNQL